MLQAAKGQYSAVQEGLAYVRKYAQAASVKLRLVVSHPYLILTLRDDGRGFDPKAARPVAGATSSGLGLALLARQAQSMRILALTMHNKPVLVKKAVNAGVHGYVVKQSRPEVLLQAILRVAAGGNYLDPELSESLYQLLLDPARDDDIDGVSASGAYPSLTPREQEIFRLLAEGLRPEQIAARLFISRKTAENHRFRLIQKLGFTTITDLVSYADELGVI